MTDTEMTKLDGQYHRIIDGLHPLFTAVSDEEIIHDEHDHGVFTRDFAHKNGKRFRFQWCVYYGTPKTVRTVFEPAVEI